MSVPLINHCLDEQPMAELSLLCTVKSGTFGRVEWLGVGCVFACVCVCVCVCAWGGGGGCWGVEGDFFFSHFIVISLFFFSSSLVFPFPTKKLSLDGILRVGGGWCGGGGF